MEKPFDRVRLKFGKEDVAIVAAAAAAAVGTSQTALASGGEAAKPSSRLSDPTMR